MGGRLGRSGHQHLPNEAHSTIDVRPHQRENRKAALVLSALDASGRARVRGVSVCFGLDRCEQVLRLKRKGRTGFKPSGLRDELPDLPVPFVN